MLDAHTESRKTKILVIEDDTLTRITLCRIFMKMNYDVVEACNGLMGIKVFEREKPDLVITDLLMPDKEGLETILDLRAKNPSIKIIAMSGGGSTQNMSFLELAEKFGANYKLSKPFKPTDILDLVKKLRLDAVQ